MRFLNSSGLERLLSKILDRLDTKVDKNQGDINEGCYLVVDENGDLVLEDMPVSLGVPDELDRIGRLRVTSSNSTLLEYELTLSDPDIGFDPYCTYAGSVHMYLPGEEYVSNLNFCEYVETQAGTDALTFVNTLVVGTSVFRFIWVLDPVELTVTIMVNASENYVRMDSLFSLNGVSRVEFIVRKAQEAVY